MYQLIYYNSLDSKDTKKHLVKFDDYELALTQYNLLKEKYQYIGIIQEGILLVGNLIIKK